MPWMGVRSGESTMQALIHAETPLTEAALVAMAHMPTASLSALVADAVWPRLSDADFMRIAVMLAEKSRQEGGCPIGAVIIDNASRRILGKGHNTLVQENHPYNHGETAALRDAGRIDFSRTTLFTSLSPCTVCASLLASRGFARVVVGDVSNAAGSEAWLRAHGVAVDILEDPRGIDLYARYRAEHPDLDLEDWKGKAAMNPSPGLP